MPDPELNLSRPPIVEAVLDIDCDMRPDFDLAETRAHASNAFADAYPLTKLRQIQRLEVHQTAGSEPTVSSGGELGALQFCHADSKQLVQVRARGYSFNRLALYEGLDKYLGEIERTWRLFISFARPLQVCEIRLRYINRMPIPLSEGRVDLEQYLTIGPQLPDEEGLWLSDFLSSYSAFDRETGAQVRAVMASQPAENETLPIILDVQVAQACELDPSDWRAIAEKIDLLRALKNRVFRRSVEERCLALFQ